MKEDHLKDLITAIGYLEGYPSVKGSEAMNWGQLINALKQIAVDLKQHLENQKQAAEEMDALFDDDRDGK
jgi:hypothetical protein